MITGASGIVGQSAQMDRDKRKRVETVRYLAHENPSEVHRVILMEKWSRLRNRVYHGWWDRQSHRSDL